MNIRTYKMWKATGYESLDSTGVFSFIESLLVNMIKYEDEYYYTYYINDLCVIKLEHFIEYIYFDIVRFKEILKFGFTYIDIRDTMIYIINKKLKTDYNHIIELGYSEINDIRNEYYKKN